MLDKGLMFADKYELVKQLGRGGFSEVWLAHDTMADNLEVAIKVYAPGTGVDDAGITIFKQEFSLVFNMNHTNLLRPTYFDEWQRMPYLILPYCKGGSTFKYIVERVVPDEETCWHILHDVAAGLAYLHEKNVIHQDIKPDNILISDEGIFMITDFGISTRVRNTMRAGANYEDQSSGTMAYMGPERFSSNPKSIRPSDVWSLGSMMFELMMDGMPPFQNQGGLLQSRDVPIPQIEGPFSDDLKWIITQCLQADPYDRPTARSVEMISYSHLNNLPLPQMQTEPRPQPKVTPQTDPQPRTSQKTQRITPKQFRDLQRQKEQNDAKAGAAAAATGNGSTSSGSQQHQSGAGSRIPPSQQQSGYTGSNGSQGSAGHVQPKGNKGLIIGLAALAAVAVIALLVVLLSGGKSGGDSISDPIEHVKDSLVNDLRKHIEAAEQFKKQADLMVENNKERLLDIPADDLELQYHRALSELNEVAGSATVLSEDKELLEKAEDMQEDIIEKLQELKACYEEKVREFIENDMSDLLDLVTPRIEAIDQYLDGVKTIEGKDQDDDD